MEDFMECATCAAKPGSPQLCKACLHNRKLVSDLRRAARKTKEMKSFVVDLYKTVTLKTSVIVEAEDESCIEDVCWDGADWSDAEVLNEDNHYVARIEEMT